MTQKNETTKRALGYLKVLGLSIVVWVGLANFAFVPHWISEMIGAAPLNTTMSDEVIFASIFIFATSLAFIFFNRVFAMVSDLLQEAAS